MRTLKKTLALVLSVALAVSLLAVGASAATTSTTFSDASSVQYTEAVNVMTAVGVINGYSDGSFKPAGTITREEAAKMITYAVLGPTTASALSARGTTFSDVAADRWSAPYIGYCVSQGIINGMGDGTFAPTANVTGYQLAKMMLAAAGYGKAGEFTGVNWAINVAVASNKYGVFKTTKATDLNKAATREEASLYVFNGITRVPEVTYSKLTDTYTNVTNKVNAFAGVTLSETPAANGDTNDYIAEDIFTNLTASATTVGGATGYAWMLNGNSISSFVSSVKALATSTNGTAYADLTDPSKSTYIGYQPETAYNSGTVHYYYNDAEKTVSGDITTLKNAASTVGAVVQFLDTNNNGYYDQVSVTVKSVQQLGAAPTVTTTGSVTNVTIGNLGTVLSTAIVYPAGLVKGDVILSYTGANGKIYVEKATPITGTITSYVDTKYVTINGTNYYQSGLAGAPAAYDTFDELKALLGLSGYTFYLDNGNNIVYTVAPSGTATVTNTLFVSAVQYTASFGSYTFQAIAVKPDGTQSTITVNKTAIDSVTPPVALSTTVATVGGANPADTTIGSGAYHAAATGYLYAGNFYTYTVNSDGSYNLIYAAHQSYNKTDLTKGTNTTGLDANDTSYVVTGNKAQFLGAVTATGTTWSGLTPVYTASKIATSGTIFLYYDSSAKTYTAVTGIAAAQTYAAGGTIYVLADSSTDTYAQIVVCTGASSTTSAANYDQYFITSPATVSADSNNTTIYSYTAVANGVVGKTVTSYDPLTIGTLYFAKDYATNGAIKTGAASTSVAGTKHTALTDVAYAGGVLTVTGTPSASYVLSSNVVINLCSVNGSTISVSQITADSADALAYAGTNDTIVLVPVSTSDSTIAAVYIYQIV